MARPTKLTPAVQAAIVNAATEGVPLSRAAQLAGVNKYTVLEWLARGQGTDGRSQTPHYTQFAHAIAYARAICGSPW